MQKKQTQEHMPPPRVMPPRPPRTITYTTNVVMEDGGTPIRTTVTSSGAAVERFLHEVVRTTTRRPLLVGIDTEWRFLYDSDGRRSGVRTAVLQLCVGHRCLVFQISRADYVPAPALAEFFTCPDHQFAGVAVAGDVRRLAEDYGFTVARPLELTRLAAEVLREPTLKTKGLKDLTLEVMGVEIDKDKRITMSKWGAYRLSPEQVTYACVDAYTSYEIGRLLLSRQAEGGVVISAGDQGGGKDTSDIAAGCDGNTKGGKPRRRRTRRFRYGSYDDEGCFNSCW